MVIVLTYHVCFTRSAPSRFALNASELVLFAALDGDNGDGDGDV